MKHPVRQFPVKTLFVLGAGASFSASQGQAPLDAGICKLICEASYKRPAWVGDSCKFIRRYWRDEKPLQDCGLEEAVLRQLGHIDFYNSVYKRRKTSANTSFRYLNHLTHAMLFILSKAHEHASKPYKVFADNIFPENFTSCVDRVITFNYDNLLDRHLLQRFEREQVYFDRIGDSIEPPAKRRMKCPSPFLIKLHGSINWRCAVEDFDRIIGGDKETNTSTSDKSDPDMHIWLSDEITSPKDNVAPLVIPPLPAKPLSSIGIFRWLWTKAFEYLCQAETIVVCGYSLPEADQFARSLFGNFRNERLKKVTIVDPNPSILGKWRGLFQRKNLPSIQWEWADDFSEYVRHL